MKRLLSSLVLLLAAMPLMAADSRELANRAEAVYHSYWQTLRKGTDNRYATGGFGTSEDRLVKRNGKWLIAFRKLTVFTE